MKEGGVEEKILKILLGIFGLGVLLVCILGVLFSIPGLDKLDWFLVGVGVASVLWYIYHIKYTNPGKHKAIMDELKGKRNKQDTEQSEIASLKPLLLRQFFSYGLLPGEGG